jgi:hypothetical protein
MFIIIDSTSFKAYGPFPNRDEARTYLLKKIGNRNKTERGDSITVMAETAQKTVGFQLPSDFDSLNTFYIKELTNPP